MADYPEHIDPARPASQRFRKIAQAAMNADMTLEQVEEVLGNMGEILGGMQQTMDNLDGAVVTLDETMANMNRTLSQIDDMTARMTTIVGRMEGIVGRVEHLVGLGEVALLPVSVLESAGRGVASLLGIGGRGDDEARDQMTEV